MSDHEMDKSLISAYCDGELNAVELAQVEKLLETSAAARAELQAYRSLSALLQNAGRPQVQANLTASVMHAIQTRDVAASTTVVTPSRITTDKSQKTKRWATLVATSAACLAFMVWAGINRGGKQDVAHNGDPNSTQNISVKSSAISPDTVTAPPVIAEDTKPIEPVIAQADQKPAGKPLDASELPVELIADLKNSEVGRIQKFIAKNKGGVTVFHLMVVDLKPGMESLEMILSAEKISVNGKPVNERADVMAVYVEADQTKMDSLVQKIKDEHAKFLALAVQESATPMEQVASIAAKKQTTDSPQAVPVNVGDLRKVGVAPLKTEQIEMAVNQPVRRGHRPISSGQALISGSDGPQETVSPLRKLLILVEKATPESLIRQPVIQK